jgi:hypothetical protein
LVLQASTLQIVLVYNLFSGGFTLSVVLSGPSGCLSHARLVLLGPAVSPNRISVLIFFFAAQVPLFSWGQGNTGSVVVSGNPDAPQVLDTFLYAPVYTKSIDVWNPPVAERMSGTIEEFNEESIIFLQDGERRELPSNRVAAVQPVWKSELAAKAHQLFMDRQYKQAIEAIPAAVKSNLPRWQQRLLIAHIVDSAVAIGSVKGAAGVFLDSLAPNQPPAMLYSSLPLCWTSDEPDRLLRQAAMEWLDSDNEVAQLVGASWLLLGAESEAARRKLVRLQTSKREPIAALAVVQGWRLVSPSDTAAKLPGWFDYRDRLIEPLQIGPTEFLADRLSRIGMTELAIGQWSRIASVHPGRYHRGAKALQAAQVQLQQQGRTEESKRLQAWIEQLQAAP